MEIQLLEPYIFGERQTVPMAQLMRQEPTLVAQLLEV
jgi:hypothetical protein